MFRKKMLVLSATSVTLSTLWIFHMTWMRDRDIETYRQLSHEKEIASSASKKPASQHRKGVQKELWISQKEGPRLHYEISSKDSVLTMTPVGNRFEMVESLSGIKAWMQDCLITDGKGEHPAQQARYIEAETGSFSHASQEFFASEVQLFLFQLDGHVLPKRKLSKDKAYLTGVAKDISLSFPHSQAPILQAHQFQAKKRGVKE